MEGIGSRLGRASSRYGPAPVFSGPVRKWKRQWVQVSSSQNASHSINGNNNNSSLLLCKWTPLPPNNSPDSHDDSDQPEPPKRKFRYTPIVVLEEKKREVPAKAELERSGTKTNESMARETSVTNDVFDKSDIDNLFNEYPEGSHNGKSGEEHSRRSQMDLDLSLKGDEDDRPDSDGESEEADEG